MDKYADKVLFDEVALEDILEDLNHSYMCEIDESEDNCDIDKDIVSVLSDIGLRVCINCGIMFIPDYETQVDCEMCQMLTEVDDFIEDEEIDDFLSFD